MKLPGDTVQKSMVMILFVETQATVTAAMIPWFILENKMKVCFFLLSFQQNASTSL